MIQQEKVKAFVQSYKAPHSEHTLADLKAHVECSIASQITITVSYPVGQVDAWLKSFQVDFGQQFGDVQVPKVSFLVQVKARSLATTMKRHPKIRNVIAVGAGKGGVGKSTVAVRMAEALHALGARVGLLDADLYGPNVPHLLGQNAPEQSSESTELVPTVLRGISVISLGQYVARSDAVAWRGPMAGKVLEQLFFDAEWPELDYLIVDLPPGTGDVVLTLGKKLPVTAALLVTTPQTVACMDAEKALAMFKKLAVPVLGFVNNMAQYACQKCGHEQEIFHGLETDELSGKLGLPCLARLPLQQDLARKNEAGQPLATDSSCEKMVKVLEQLAIKLTLKLCFMKKDYSLIMPKIEIQTKS